MVQVGGLPVGRALISEVFTGIWCWLRFLVAFGGVCGWLYRTGHGYWLKYGWVGFESFAF